MFSQCFEVFPTLMGCMFICRYCEVSLSPTLTSQLRSTIVYTILGSRFLFVVCGERGLILKRNWSLMINIKLNLTLSQCQRSGRKSKHLHRNSPSLIQRFSLLNSTLTRWSTWLFLSSNNDYLVMFWKSICLIPKPVKVFFDRRVLCRVLSQILWTSVFLTFFNEPANCVFFSQSRLKVSMFLPYVLFVFLPITSKQSSQLPLQPVQHRSRLLPVILMESSCALLVTLAIWLNHWMSTRYSARVAMEQWRAYQISFESSWMRPDLIQDHHKPPSIEKTKNPTHRQMIKVTAAQMKNLIFEKKKLMENLFWNYRMLHSKECEFLNQSIHPKPILTSEFREEEVCLMSIFTSKLHAGIWWATSQHCLLIAWTVWCRVIKINDFRPKIKQKFRSECCFLPISRTNLIYLTWLGSFCKNACIYSFLSDIDRWIERFTIFQMKAYNRSVIREMRKVVNNTFCFTVH